MLTRETYRLEVPFRSINKAHNIPEFRFIVSASKLKYNLKLNENWQFVPQYGSCNKDMIERENRHLYKISLNYSHAEALVERASTISLQEGPIVFEMPFSRERVELIGKEGTALQIEKWVIVDMMRTVIKSCYYISDSILVEKGHIFVSIALINQPAFNQLMNNLQELFPLSYTTWLT